MNKSSPAGATPQRLQFRTAPSCGEAPGSVRPPAQVAASSPATAPRTPAADRPHRWRPEPPSVGCTPRCDPAAAAEGSPGRREHTTEHPHGKLTSFWGKRLRGLRGRRVCRQRDKNGLTREEIKRARSLGLLFWEHLQETQEARGARPLGAGGPGAGRTRGWSGSRWAGHGQTLWSDAPAPAFCPPPRASGHLVPESPEGLGGPFPVTFQPPAGALWSACLFSVKRIL